MLQRIQTSERFGEKCSDVSVQIIYGNHEELYGPLRFDKIDIAMNDQRRAFPSEYKSMTLAELQTGGRAKPGLAIRELLGDVAQTFEH